VGIGTVAPNPNALLDLTANDKGLLVPRMTTAQRLAIATAGATDQGLLVYDTDIQRFFYWDATQWVEMPTPDDGDWTVNGTDLYATPPGNVGIGTVVPAAKLHTVGSLRFEGLATGLDEDVLIINAAGDISTRNLTPDIWDGDDVDDADNDPANEYNTSVSFDNTTKIFSITDGGGTLTTLIPTTDITDIVAGAGLTGGGNVGAVILDAQADNGLYVDIASDAIRLGGPLIQHTTIDNGNFDMIYNISGTGRFEIQDNSNSAFMVNENGQTGINTPVPDPSALFQVSSTTKGVLLPAMNTAQRDLIPAPAVGLTVYNTDDNVHQFWNGTCWLNVGQTVCTDFSLAVSTASGCIATSSSSSTDTDLTITLNSGTAVPVLLGAAGLPAGVSVSFSANPVIPTTSSTATLTGSPSTPPGIYTIDFMAIYGSSIQTVQYTLEVVGFTYTVSSGTGTVQEIDLAPNSTTVTTNIDIQFSGTCGTGSTTTLSVANLPPGVTASFSTNPIVANPGNSVLTFTASSCAVVGTYNVVINADVGGTLLSTPYVLNITPSIVDITTNQVEYDLYSSVGSPPCPIELVCNIPAGVTINSSATINPAFTSGCFPSGSLITINNAGDILGRGGAGGSIAGSNNTTCPNIDGEPGGPALFLDACSQINLNNTGNIFGGGGGGGSGGDLSALNLCLSARRGAGGGGGAGGGPGGAGPGCGGSAGANGAVLAAGTGGVGGVGCTVTCTLPFVGQQTESGGDGGDGGDWGQAGQGGSASTLFDFDRCTEGSGGAGGAAIIGTANLSASSNVGTTAGALVP